MSYHLLYETALGRTRAALFDDQFRLLMLRQDDPSRPLIEGAVVWGRVRTVTKGLGAAFVDVGDTHDGVLPLGTLPPGTKMTEGKKLLVRVTRGGFGEKGPKLDGRVAVKEPAADAAVPQRVKAALPAIVRALHDANATPVTVWLCDAALIDEVKKHVPERAIRLLTDGDAPALEEGIEEALDAMLSSRPTFAFNGGNLIVEITSAVATIDVNSGLMGGATRAEAILAANLRAAEEVARLCRLLDLGGSVIVDFITPPTKQHRSIVTEHLKASFAAADEGDVEIRPMSRHGLVELTRQRTGPSLNLLQGVPDFVAARVILALWRQRGVTAGKRRSKGKSIVCNPVVAQVLKAALTESVCLTQLGFAVEVKAEPLCGPVVYRIADL